MATWLKSSIKNFSQVLIDGRNIKKTSLKVIEIARERFKSTLVVEVIIKNVPYYNGLTVIVAKEPKNPCCQNCCNNLSYSNRYDEMVQENCKYIGQGL